MIQRSTLSAFWMILRMGAGRRGVNLRIKGNSCETGRLLLFMVGWFCLFVFKCFCFSKDEVRHTHTHKNKNRKGNIKDRNLHLRQFFLPETDSLLEEDKPRTQAIILSKSRKALGSSGSQRT